MPSIRLVLATLAAACLLSMTASAQDALGDGHALDSNLSTQGKRNTGRMTGDDARFSLSRRALSGRGYHSTVGYESNADFRARNSELTMYADSLNNNPWYWENLGNLTTELVSSGGSGSLGAAGANIGGGYYNPYFWNANADNAARVDLGRRIGDHGDLQRPFGGTNPNNVSPLEYDDTQVDDRSRPVTYSIGQPHRYLQDERRSSVLRSHYEMRDLNSQPNYIGVGVSAADIPVRYSASTLQGIVPTTYPLSHLDMGISQLDMARLFDDNREGRTQSDIGAPWRINFNILSNEDNRIVDDSDGDRIVNRADETLDDLLAKIGERYEEARGTDMTEDPGTLTMLQDDYRNVLGEILDGRGMDEAPMGLEPENIAGINEPAVTPETTIPGEEGTESLEPAPSTTTLMPLEEFGLVLRHGQQVDAFANDDKSRVSELILAGQDKLQQGEYFWAERRFNRALRMEPGQPLATAGLAHAQLGAGLYLSSSLTLQSLLAFQPEMIDVVYDESLLPTQEDLDRAIRELNRRLTAERDADRYAFLLAYIGHQTGNGAMVQQGLREMRKAHGEEPFIRLLEQIWLPERNSVDTEPVELIELQPVEEVEVERAPEPAPEIREEPKPEPKPEPVEPVGGDILDD